MTATGGSCEPRSLSSQNTDPRGKRAAGPLISGIKSRKYEYLSLQSEPLCTAKSWLFSAPFECLFLLAEWNCLALQHICGSFFPPSTASRHCAQWDRGQRLHCRLCGHKKATILLGFMIIMSKIKTHLMPQKKKKYPSDFVLLQAPVNVKTRSRGIMMCRWVLFLFLWRLMSGTNAVRLQDDLNNIQTVHSSLQILWTPTFSSWHVWLASCDVDQNYYLILDIFFLPAWKVSMSVN